MISFKAAIACMALLPCMIAVSYAQVEDRGDFFSNGYADESSATDEAVVENSGLDVTEPIEEISDVTETESTAPVLHASLKSSTDDIDEHSNPVTGVTVFVNSADSNHFKKVVQALSATARQRKLKVGGVFHLGATDPVDPAVEAEASRAGAELHQINVSPTQVGITKSPTWVLSTKKGFIIIEGAPSLVRYLSVENEFVAPIGAAIRKGESGGEKSF